VHVGRREYWILPPALASLELSGAGGRHPSPLQACLPRFLPPPRWSREPEAWRTVRRAATGSPRFLSHMPSKPRSPSSFVVSRGGLWPPHVISDFPWSGSACFGSAPCGACSTGTPCLTGSGSSPVRRQPHRCLHSVIAPVVTLCGLSPSLSLPLVGSRVVHGVRLDNWASAGSASHSCEVVQGPVPGVRPAAASFCRYRPTRGARCAVASSLGRGRSVAVVGHRRSPSGCQIHLPMILIDASLMHGAVSATSRPSSWVGPVVLLTTSPPLLGAAVVSPRLAVVPAASRYQLGGSHRCGFKRFQIISGVVARSSIYLGRFLVACGLWHLLGCSGSSLFSARVTRCHSSNLALNQGLWLVVVRSWV
jgi:hypothetical protein